MSDFSWDRPNSTPDISPVQMLVGVKNEQLKRNKRMLKRGKGTKGVFVGKKTLFSHVQLVNFLGKYFLSEINFLKMSKMTS